MRLPWVYFVLGLSVLYISLLIRLLESLLCHPVLAELIVLSITSNFRLLAEMEYLLPKSLS